MAIEVNKSYEEEKKLIESDFVEKMTAQFNRDEAEDIAFTLGCDIRDKDVRILVEVEDGNLSFKMDISREEVEEADIFVGAPLEIFEQFISREIAVSDLEQIDEEIVYFGGDMGLIYELYNIFNITA